MTEAVPTRGSAASAGRVMAKTTNHVKNASRLLFTQGADTAQYLSCASSRGGLRLLAGSTVRLQTRAATFVAPLRLTPWLVLRVPRQLAN